MYKFFMPNNANNYTILLCAFLTLTLFLSALVGSAHAMPAPVKNDQRIKTLVYNSEEVFTVVARKGFKTTIELSKREKIETISLGDSIGWQITPAKNRIFIKPLLLNNTTNLTVITNKRTYQFELVVSTAQIKNASHAYMVKFFYPEEVSSVGIEDRMRGDAMRPISATAIPEMPVPQPFNQPFVAPSMPASSLSGLPSLGSIGIQAYNFNYTLTGPEDKSPTKIFDDGRSTYFEYDSNLNSTPSFYAVNADGSESVLDARSEGNRFIVNFISPRFVIKHSGAEQICVFNESVIASTPRASEISGSGSNF